MLPVTEHKLMSTRVKGETGKDALSLIGSLAEANPESFRPLVFGTDAKGFEYFIFAGAHMDPIVFRRELVKVLVKPPAPKNKGHGRPKKIAESKKSGACEIPELDPWTFTRV